MVLLHTLVFFFFLNFVFTPSTILFVKTNRGNYMVCMLLSICYISAFKLGLYDLVSCYITLILHLVFTSFHTDFVGFPYENHPVKTSSMVLMIYGYDYCWYMHKLCFAGTNKFKQNITSKSRICLHQIGGDC